jgi:hypothetical protein
MRVVLARTFTRRACIRIEMNANMRASDSLLGAAPETLARLPVHKVIFIQPGSIQHTIRSFLMHHVEAGFLYVT